ncbi:MAG: (d)CMP kinase [Myxococcota bacterium]
MSTHIVAIDGPAGAGKSTIATMVADELGFQLIDTGALYRTVAYLALQKGVDLEDAEAVADIAAGLDLEFRKEDGDNVLYCDGEALRGEIRTEEVGRGASVISAHPEVRDALIGAQRDMGEARSSVLEGRDIGTVVFPNADVKVFLTADPKVRANRRVDQLEERGEDVDFDEVYRDIVERDRRDREREVAPLKQAEDAVCVDTSDLRIEEVVSEILGIVKVGL